VREFRASEALNQPYEINLELVSERHDLDLEALQHRPAFLRFGPDGAGLHGQVYQIAQGDSGKRLSHYQITLVPHLAYLTHGHNQRIFQNQSVPQIIASVLKDQGMQADTWRFHLSIEYRPRRYCVQYESDLHFIQRLCTAPMGMCWCSATIRPAFSDPTGQPRTGKTPTWSPKRQ
jgi:type VI secretion system secreted protein VgrG